MKTLIELFDECQIENAIGGLSYRPDTIVFLGYPETMTKRRCQDLTRFFTHKLPDTTLCFEPIERAEFGEISKQLSDLLEQHKDVAFDLTGGEELVLAAMGAVAEESGIAMLQFDVETGELRRIKNCENLPEPLCVKITAEESILLNGGAIVSPEDDFSWLMTADFKSDIETMWAISRRDSKRWNRQLYALSTLSSWANGGDSLSLTVRMNQLPPRGVYVPEAEFLSTLAEFGLITRLLQNDSFLSFRFKNEQVQRCLLKAGNILELYGYLIACEICEEEPGYFDDVLIGVTVDWDGVIHYDSKQKKDTKNEIDLLMMRKTLPVFISCKNGEVHKEALYELETVAEHFGGKYAKKILLSTHIDFDESARRYLLTRAEDMGISVLCDAHLLSKEELKDELRRLIK